MLAKQAFARTQAGVDQGHYRSGSRPSQDWIKAIRQHEMQCLDGERDSARARARARERKTERETLWVRARAREKEREREREERATETERERERERERGTLGPEDPGHKGMARIPDTQGSRGALYITAKGRGVPTEAASQKLNNKIEY